MSYAVIERELLSGLAIFAALMPVHPSVSQRAALTQASGRYVRRVRTMETESLGIGSPGGLAFSASANAFYVVSTWRRTQPVPPQTEIATVTPFVKRNGSARIAAAIRDPINMAFDNHAGRLLILQAAAQTLMTVTEGQAGRLDTTRVVRQDVRSFGLGDPQGMAVDPLSGTLFVLDASGPRIVRVTPDAQGSFEDGVIAEIDLRTTGSRDLRGLAWDSASGHFYVLSPTAQVLYEVTATGQVVTTRDVSGMGLADPQGMVIAPSGDTTDDPAEMSLYVADSGTLTSSTQSTGNITELSFSPLAAAAATDFVAQLVRTVDTAAYDPPSPDPSGLTYIPSSTTLVMSDGEVEETVNGITHFQGVNVWETDLSGNVVNTANISKVAPTVVPMTNEPTGTAWNPTTGHFYFSDDDAAKVYDLDPGPDGQYGTADDSWTSFDTSSAGSDDSEGVAFDSWNNHIFVADGVNMEVYEFTLTGSLVNHFDVEQYGVADPESVEFNAQSGTLFVMSSNIATPIIVETTTSGALLQTIDISAAGARAAAGLAYAPASDGSGVLHFYIVDRGIDNNTDPNIIDGKMYEMTASAPPTAVNLPPVAVDDAYSTRENTLLTVGSPGVLSNDSGFGIASLAAVLVTNATHGSLNLNDDGSFTYQPDPGFVGTDSFTYQAFDDMAYSDIVTVQIVVEHRTYLPLIMRHR